MGDPERSEHGPTPGAAAEVQALVALVQARYGHRLDEAQRAEVERQVAAIVERARALRACPLAPTDEPTPPWAPHRADP
jgi:hypothetical protein